MEVTPDRSSLVEAIEMLQKDSTLCALPDVGSYAVMLALDELGSNVIDHGSGATEMSLACWADESQILILFEDNGLHFDPDSAPTPQTDIAMEDRKVGGLGIHILKNFMDRMEWTCSEDKNCFFLQKKLKTGETVIQKHERHYS